VYYRRQLEALGDRFELERKDADRLRTDVIERGEALAQSERQRQTDQEQCDEEKVNLARDLREQERLRKDAQRELGMLKFQLGTSTTENERLQMELAAVQPSGSESDKDRLIAKQKHDLLAQRGAHQQDRGILREEIDTRRTLEAEQTQLKQQVEQSKSALTEAQTKTTRFKDDAVHAGEERDTLKRKLDKCDTEKATIRNELREAQHEILAAMARATVLENAAVRPEGVSLGTQTETTTESLGTQTLVNQQTQTTADVGTRTTTNTGTSPSHADAFGKREERPPTPE
jgi:chromosome segregation ATPase